MKKIKLIRDKLGGRGGDTESVGFANSPQAKQALLVLKLFEEVGEIAADSSDPYEYADALEALFELARINHVPFQTIVSCMKIKRAEKGGFREGKYIYR